MDININGFKIVELTDIPANMNPFLYDDYSMGTSIGNNMMVMYDKHTDERAGYLIIVNIETGKRLKLIF